MILDITNLMKGLSSERPIFHTEADFQHALAWYIHKKMPDCQLRLELKPFKNERKYLDIWLRGMGIAIELKYKTKKLVYCGDEPFALRNQYAQDFGRYDFIKDICRLEQVVTHFETAKVAFAILLTNDSSYWELSKPDLEDAAFHLNNGTKIMGKREWSMKADLEKKKGRKMPLCLEGAYDCVWRNYSSPKFVEGKNRQFQYLMVKVPCPGT